jgi:hypothetical protein
MENNFNKKVVKIIVDNVLMNPYNPALNNGNPRSSGTGFFIDNKGTVLTCSHVIENGANITIEIPGLNKVFKAKLLGIMPELDIGLLSVDYKSKEYFKLGDSSKVKLGMDIYVLGFPGTHSSEMNLKINKGIISGTLGSNIMIDSPINPGNSGGPLVYKNKVIGINIAMLIGKQNMNISVPIHIFQNFESQLRSTKSIITYRNYLPLLFNNSNNTFYNNSFKKEGVYIYDDLNEVNIPKNSILYKIDNYNIDNYGKLNYKWFSEKMNIDNYILNKPPNSQIKLYYYDITNKKNKSVKYQLKPFIKPIRDKFPLFEKIDFLNIAGGIFQELNNNIIDNNEIFYLKFLNYKLNPLLQNDSVVVITFIYSNSYLGKLDVFYDGTIINKLNDKKIKSFQHFKTMIQQNKNKKIKLESDDGKTVFIDLIQPKNNNILTSKLLI